MNNSVLLSNIIPVTADIFVFFFPIVLLIIYFIGLRKSNKYLKISALRIFWCAILTTIINILIQFFFFKQRPLVTLLGQNQTETVLHKFLPNSSFPSDHSAMSMGFAMGLLLWGIKNKDKKFIWIGVLFLIFSLLMGFSRVMVGAHRPTDVLGGFMIGILVPCIMNLSVIYIFIEKFLINPIIRLQEGLWKLFKLSK